MLSSLFVLVSSRSTDSQLEDIARIQLARTALESEASQLSKLEQSAKQKIESLVALLAELEAKVQVLEHNNELVADKLGISAKDLQAFDSQSVTVNSSVDDTLLAQIRHVQLSIDEQTRQLTTLEKLVKGRHIDEMTLVSGKPIRSGWLSSHYGMRDDPFTGKPAMHKGLDFAGIMGAGVIATGAGIVTWAGDRYGYGQLVEIDHGNGLVSRYGHNSDIKVSIGDVVTKGQIIALMGSSGRSTGAHVHYEVLKNGTQVDPLSYVY